LHDFYLKELREVKNQLPENSFIDANNQTILEKML